VRPAKVRENGSQMPNHAATIAVTGIKRPAAKLTRIITMNGNMAASLVYENEDMRGKENCQ
jgi:hypothetical protein